MSDHLIDRWIAQVCGYLAPGRYRRRVEQELRTHLNDRIRVLRCSGQPHENAVRLAIASMGDPDALGRALSASDRPMRRLLHALTTILLWLAIFVLLLYLFWRIYLCLTI